MRLTGYLLALAGIAAAATGAQAEEVTGRQNGDSLVYDVSGFDSIGLGTPATVEIRVGPTWSVRASGPESALAALRVEKEGQSLRITPRGGWRSGNTAAARQVRLIIAMPQLAGASVGGSSRMTVDRVTGPSLRARVGGSGSLAFGTLAVEELDVGIGGSGAITAAGRATRLKVSNGGSGSLTAPDLRASTAAVSVAGSGHVRALVDGTATVAVAGSGMVDLGRGAQCTVRRAGSGRVICGS